MLTDTVGRGLGFGRGGVSEVGCAGVSSSPDMCSAEKVNSGASAGLGSAVWVEKECIYGIGCYTVGMLV